MNKETLTNVKFGWWMLAAAAVLYFGLPILATIVWSGVAIAAGLAILVAGYIMMPAVIEMLSQASMWLWIAVIQKNPVARLYRDLEAFRQDLDNSAKEIGKQSGQAAVSRREFENNRKHFSDTEARQWEEDLDAADESISMLREEVRLQEAEYVKFEQVIARAEANWRMQKSMGGLLKVLSGGKKEGKDSQGSKVALDEVASKLAENRSRLSIAVDRQRVRRDVERQGANAALSDMRTIDVPAVQIPADNVRVLSAR